MQRDPICRVCREKLATTVDHITPKHLGGDDAPENLQGLCEDCHTEKTTREAVAARVVHTKKKREKKREIS